MGPTVDKKHEEARLRLLEEGARSYLDAVSALIAYREDVQSICRTVLAKHLNDYGSALELRLGTDEIQNAEWPSFKEWEGDWWTLGVRVLRKNMIPTIRWWEAYCCLSYESGDAGLYCWIGEGFPSRQLAAELYRKFRSLNKKVECDDNELCIRRSLQVEDVCNLETNLDAVVQEWIELWKEVGGIKQVFPG